MNRKPLMNSNPKTIKVSDRFFALCIVYVQIVLMMIMGYSHVFGILIAVLVFIKCVGFIV